MNLNVNGFDSKLSNKFVVSIKLLKDYFFEIEIIYLANFLFLSIKYILANLE